MTMMVRCLQLQNRLLPHYGIGKGAFSASQPSRCLFGGARNGAALLCKPKLHPRISHAVLLRLGKPLPRTHNGSRRLLSTAEAKVTEVPSTPPLAVRTALVATTTAIATPACPVVFVVNLGLRYVVWDAEARRAILGATTLVGAVFTLVNFATFDLLPLAYSYGQLFLPFAMVNGGLAGTAYLGMDLALGTAQVARLPWTGAAMGAFVGLVGPVSGLYDVTFQWCYDIPEFDGAVTNLLNNRFMLPLSMATGAAIGAMMHPLLYYPVVGIKGIHWANFSAPLLAAAAVAATSLYAADYYDSRIFPPETYLTADESRGLMLVPRFHAKRLQVEDWGPQVGYQPLGTGVQARESVVAKLEATKRGDFRSDMVFDSRRKAWLHWVTGGLFGEDYAVDAVPSQTEINQQGQRYLPSDGTVAFIMLQGGQVHKNQTNATKMLREDLMQLVSDIQTENRRYKRSKTKPKSTVDRIELASHGIALLLTHQKISGDDDDKTDERQLKRLEKGIRKVVPGILLFKKEEGDETQGCSVESQLDAFGWTGIQDEALKQHTSRQWRAGLHQFLTAEQAQANARQLTWAITGLGVVVLYGLFGGTQ